MHRYLAFLFVLMVSPDWAAIPASAVWEVRGIVGAGNTCTGGGASNCGGGWDTAGTGVDMSQFDNKNAASCTLCQSSTNNLSTTDLTTTITGAFTATSATAAFTSAITGNLIYLTGGTGGSVTAGWYEATYASATTITLDRSPGAAATLVTMNIGGALAGLVTLNSAMVGGNVAWVKAVAVYERAATTPFNFTGGSTNQYPAIIGYTTTRGDGGMVTVEPTASMNPVVNLASNGLTFENFIINCNGETTSGLSLTNNATRAINLIVEGCNGTGGYAGISLNGNPSYCVSCVVTGMTSGSGTNYAFYADNGNEQLCLYCVAYGNAVTGFGLGEGQAGPGSVCWGCISANNSGASSDGFQITQDQGNAGLFNCVAYGNGRDGFRLTSGGYGSLTVMNNISHGNSAYGINYTNGALASSAALFNWNAYGGNTTANLYQLTAGPNDVTLTASPFVDGASNNFALSGGGITAVGGLGFPGVLNAGGTGYLDMGALQHKATVGGGQQGHPIIQ